ncbi:unnamed protein product, partial [Closterium sp. NIES-54]
CCPHFSLPPSPFPFPVPVPPHSPFPLPPSPFPLPLCSLFPFPLPQPLPLSPHGQVEEREKDIGSSEGMKRSAQTSKLLQLRAELDMCGQQPVPRHVFMLPSSLPSSPLPPSLPSLQHVVPERITAMEAAIATRDFPAFARLTCADSNQFHATCLDTAPPIFYLNATQHNTFDAGPNAVMFAERHNATPFPSLFPPPTPRLPPFPPHQAAYTFDAGPNAVMFVERHNATDFLSAFLHRFPPPDSTPLSRYSPSPL